MRRLVPLALVAALALGGSAGARTRGLAWSVTTAPFAVRIVDGAKVVTTVGGAQAPLRYVTTAGVEHRALTLASVRRAGAKTTYTLATDEPGRTASLAVWAQGGHIRLHFTVSHPQTVSAVGVGFAASARDHFLGSGERLRWVDMRSTVVPLMVRNQCGSNAPSPFAVSPSGLGVWSSTVAVGRMGFPGRADDTNFACDLGSPPCSVGAPTAAVRFCFKSPAADFEVAAGDLPTLVSEHAKAVGLPRAPWLQQLALIQWRDVVTGPSMLLGDIAEMKSLGLPLGWVILDNPWETNASNNFCYGALTFNPNVYPDPKALIDAVHAQGVRFMLWISPQIQKKGCPDLGYPDGWLTGNDDTWVRDLTNPAESADFAKRLAALVALGVDGFKGDRGDEIDLERDTLYGGPGTQLQNVIPLIYDRMAAAALRAAHGANFATLFRSYVPGSSAVLPGISGPDENQTWNGLVNAIRAGQTAGVAGDPVWGTDIGGYEGGTLTPDLFVRWAQFSAVTPIFEVGGAGLNAAFWQLGPGAIEGFRAAATLHYELAPFLYELTAEASRTGLPAIRPLGLTWPDDARAWSSDLEFTVGDALLAAPVTTENGTTHVYLPAGTWTDVFTGRRYAGGRTVSRDSGPNDFPLYVRGGAALADNFRTPSLWPQPWKLNDLLRDDRQGWLVAPAPGVTATARDRNSVFTATADSAGNVSIEITHARAQQQVRVLSSHKLCGPGRVVSSPGGVVVAVDHAPATLKLALKACP